MLCSCLVCLTYGIICLRCNKGIRSGHTCEIFFVKRREKVRWKDEVPWWPEARGEEIRTKRELSMNLNDDGNAFLLELCLYND